MIVYFDTSALVPMLVGEPSTETCRGLWNAADDVTTSQLAFVESAAALAQGHRLCRLDDGQHRSALRALRRMDDELLTIHVDESLLRRAGELAHEQQLRAYDAVHCATAEKIATSDLVVAAGDQALLRACQALGLATTDVNA